MNWKKFTGLIFMMLFSIIGIIWVQIIWIRNAVGVRNDNFDHIVIASIHDAADAIESSGRMKFFNNFMYPGANPFNDQGNSITEFSSSGTYSIGSGTDFSIRITNQSITRVPGQEPKITRYDTIISSDTLPLVSATPGTEIKTDAGEGRVAVMDNQAGISQGQNEFMEWLKRRHNEVSNMSDRMISEVFRWEKTMEIDNKEVDYALNRSLLFTGIDTPFEFAIIKNGVVTEGTHKKSGNNDFLKSKYMVRLFPDNIIRQDLILSVVFPERANYVLGSMAWILGGSMLFSLIILATFALSLFFLIRQKKISEMKSDFINNMTHEFKTPIATISLAADTIINPKVITDESGIRHFISMIKKENSRMNKKVETILQIASLDKKEIEFKFEELSLHSLIERAVDTIDILVQQRNGTVKLILNAQEHVLKGDSEHLYNLVNNLLDNALKYSPDSPFITIETSSNGEGINMSVEDKGIGMSKSVQSKIFERFYRQTSGNVHDVKGFGLGLNYARAIIEAHRGEIKVHSEPGRGSRFEVFLPYNPESKI